MKVTLWGTRGSVPVASQETTKYGGNTTCIEVETDAGECIIIDAGTGIRELGRDLLCRREKKKYTLLLTHGHWDHVQGLPFFAPVYDTGCTVDVFGSRTLAEDGVRNLLEQIFNGKNFPLGMDQLSCTFGVHDFLPGESFRVGSALIETCPTVHQGGNVAYRITADGWSFVFTGDHEWTSEGDDLAVCTNFEEFFAGADVLLADAQYTEHDYNTLYKSWGHSFIEDWPHRAVKNRVRRLIFTHHDPTRSDEDLGRLYAEVKKKFASLPLSFVFAEEGMTITAPSFSQRNYLHPNESLSNWLCDFSSDLSHYTDVGMILDNILTEARKTSLSDAGTIYLVEDAELVFAYTQNASLFSEAESMRRIYQSARIPVNEFSIAGYAAITQRPLIIDDVRAIEPDSPYKFNDSMDKASGYQTVSMMVVPLILKGKVLGVLQLINRLDASGRAIPYSVDSEARISCLAGIAVNALERGIMANELILRMLAMTEMRDPSETGAHVIRVGSIAAEVYQQWAMNGGINITEIRRMKDHIRLAAMLHDVGKVGIPDSILKKPGKLDAEERLVMEQHCFYGKKLFHDVSSGVDTMARDVALHHHQRWDGTGYTGDPTEAARTGEDTPWAARITSVADVYDALVSQRCYKKAYEKDVALRIITEGSGTQFDPDVVKAFLEIIDLVDSIMARYPG